MSESGLGSARGGRRRPTDPILVELVRELGEEDLPLLRNPPVVGSRTPTVAKLSHSHHALAQALAEGRSDIEAGLIAGYSISRISILRRDPMFKELLAHYGTQREIIHTNVLERLRILGMNSVEELQDRLENTPEVFSPRELMELTELALIKGRVGAGGGGGTSSGSAPAAPVAISVNFVTARPAIELEASKEENS